MTSVNRRNFIPDLVWPFDMEAGVYGSAVDRNSDPEVWEAAVAADVPLVTQWDDGKHRGPEPGDIASSSASMPKAVQTMLDALEPVAGGRYLDIGTGTGYTAARIAEIAGQAGVVVTVEVDPDLSTFALASLRRAGFPSAQVQVITGDGYQGWPSGGPYNGVHVTCGIRRISHAWVTQCAPGGRIVLPWGTDFTPHDQLLTLTVSEDTRTASGRFGVGLGFMKMRSQRLVWPEHEAYTPEGWQDAARDRETGFSLADANDLTRADASFVIGLRVPGCVMHPGENDNGRRTVWLYSTRDKSVAVVTFADEEAASITEHGDRSLWAEVEDAHRWWVEHNYPEPEQFGLTVSEREQRVWLDDPKGESWAL